MRRRDMGNEVIVALAAIGMLALALTFGIVLTLSRTVASPDATASAVALAGQATKALATAPATSVATEVATSAATTAETSEATLQATSEATAIAAQASIEATNEVTSATAAPTQDVRSTATATSTATPSATNTATLVSSPTDTPTAILPSLTPSHIVPTDPPDTGIHPTNTPVITATAKVSPTPIPIAATSTCILRSGWVVYTVQQGDTLFSISRQTGITLAELQQANCMDSSGLIYWGQVILIPPGKLVLTSTPFTGAGTAVTASGNAGICPDGRIRITSPLDGATVSGIVTITGTANIPNFSFFVIDYRPAINNEFVSFGRNLLPVTNGVLVSFDPNPPHLPMGPYVIQLRVVDANGGGPQPCVIHITLAR